MYIIYIYIYIFMSERTCTPKTTESCLSFGENASHVFLEVARCPQEREIPSLRQDKHLVPIWIFVLQHLAPSAHGRFCNSHLQGTDYTQSRQQKYEEKKNLCITQQGTQPKLAKESGSMLGGQFWIQK